MAITNCSIKDSNGNDTVTFINTGSVVIGSDVAEFFITPDSGFTVRASSFANNTGTQPWLTSITLEDTDTTLTSAAGYPNADTYYPYGTTGNTVKVTVTLNSSYTMPNADTNLVFDIDDFGEYGGAQANVVSVYVDDIHDVVSNTTVTTVEGTGITATAATASSVTTTSHSGTVVGNVQTTLFTKTFAASANYYYLNPPIPNLQAGALASRYDMTYVDTTNSNGQVTQRVWTIKYTGDTNITSADQHSITWSGDDRKKPAVGGTYSEGDKIWSFAVQGEEKSISAAGEEREITVTGKEGAQYNLVVSKFGEIGATSVTDTTYNFTSQTFTASSTNSGTLTIPSSGSKSTTILFPAVSANDSYGFDIGAVGSTSLHTTVPQGSPDISINQFVSNTTYTVIIDSPIHKPSGSGEQRYDTFVSQAIALDQRENNRDVAVDTDVTLVQVCKSGFDYPVTTDAVIEAAFTTADIVIDEEIVDAQVPGVIGFSRLSAVRTDANTMTYNLTVSVEQVGTVSGNITINVDGIIIPIAE
tara:strand:+ start:7832 stop:9421 length:1590 start_codon:yes stop_codon:yes gene_type:complete